MGPREDHGPSLSVALSPKALSRYVLEVLGNGPT